MAQTFFESGIRKLKIQLQITICFRHCEDLSEANQNIFYRINTILRIYRTKHVNFKNFARNKFAQFKLNIYLSSKLIPKVDRKNELCKYFFGKFNNFHNSHINLQLALLTVPQKRFSRFG
jgi:hypothetical protein